MNSSITGKMLNLPEELGRMIDEYMGRTENFENFKHRQQQYFHKNVLVNLDKGVEREVNAHNEVDDNWKPIITYCEECYYTNDCNCNGDFKAIISRHELQQSQIKEFSDMMDVYSYRRFAEANIERRSEIINELEYKKYNPNHEYENDDRVYEDYNNSDEEYGDDEWFNNIVKLCRE